MNLQTLRIIVFIVALVIAVLARSGSSNRRAPNMPDAPAVKHAEIEAVKTSPQKFDPFPAGDLYENSAYFEFALYYSPLPTKDPATAFKSLAEAKFKQFNLVEEHAEPKLPQIIVRKVPLEKYAPPSLEQLKYFGRGMSDSQKEALQKCKQVFVLSFADAHASLLKNMRAAHELMLALATETGGTIWDEETRECFTPEAWKQRRLDRWTGELPRMTDHFVTHFYAEGELCRAITLGMRKFGLPDVCIEDVPRSQRALGNVINLVCQTMAERGKLDRAGTMSLDVSTLKDVSYRDELVKSYEAKATGKATVELANVLPQEGDPNNRIAEIRFPGPQNMNVQQRQDLIGTQLFGVKDTITQQKHDEEMMALSNKAKNELAALAPHFKSGIPQLERLMVKAPFRTASGGNEWMWIEVTRWQGVQLEGILQNDPFEVPGLTAGARVKVEQGSLFDYIHIRADGTEVGNETGKLMLKREGK